MSGVVWNRHRFMHAISLFIPSGIPYCKTPRMHVGLQVRCGSGMSTWDEAWIAYVMYQQHCMEARVRSGDWSCMPRPGRCPNQGRTGQQVSATWLAAAGWQKFYWTVSILRFLLRPRSFQLDHTRLTNQDSNIREGGVGVRRNRRRTARETLASYVLYGANSCSFIALLCPLRMDVVDAMQSVSLILG